MSNNKSSIKKLINAGFSSTSCNFKCQYCYLSESSCKVNSVKAPIFQYSVEHMAKALTQERLKGTCLFNICADGETLIPEEVPQLIKALLENGHYIEVVTNGTITKRFIQISQFDKSLLERLTFKFSFHYLELIRTNTINVFFDNINRMKLAGCSFTVEMVPHDEIVKDIEFIKNLCIEKVGAVCHLTIARDHENSLKLLSKMSLTEYKRTWESFDSDMFNFKVSTFGIKRKEYCYAGDWSIDINLGTGDTKQCYCTRFTQNIFEDINKSITFLPIGKNCSLEHCYNSHALMTLGVIPDYDSITYADVRNRTCNDGNEWLNKTLKSFISQKFVDNNKTYNTLEKSLIETRINLKKIKRYFKRMIENEEDNM